MIGRLPKASAVSRSNALPSSAGTNGWRPRRSARPARRLVPCCFSLRALEQPANVLRCHLAVILRRKMTVRQHPGRALETSAGHVRELVEAMGRVLAAGAKPA